MKVRLLLQLNAASENSEKEKWKISLSGSQQSVLNKPKADGTAALTFSVHAKDPGLWEIEKVIDLSAEYVNIVHACKGISAISSIG